VTFPGDITADELLSRFAFDSGYYRNNGSVKPKAFAPDVNDEVSVFRIDDLNPGQKWALGDAAGASRAKPACASIELVIAQVIERGLAVESAEPPERHAVIVAWPDDLRIQMQQELANAAVLHFRPND
jgi:hypothetical protein